MYRDVSEDYDHLYDHRESEFDYVDWDLETDIDALAALEAEDADTEEALANIGGKELFEFAVSLTRSVSPLSGASFGGFHV